MAKRKPLPKRRPVKKGFHDTSADKVFGIGAAMAIGLALFAAVQTPATQASVTLPEFVSREVVLYQALPDPRQRETDDAPVLRGDQADGVAAFEKARKELKRKKKPTAKELSYNAAHERGLPGALVHGMVRTESGGNPDAVSKAGACGLSQLMPATAKELGVKDCRDARQNVKGGATYLSQMTDRYGNSTLGLIAYNYGPGNTDRWLARGGHWSQLPKETRDYVSKVKLNEALSERETQLAMAEK